MKKNYVLIILNLFFCAALFSQGTWTPKLSLPGNGRQYGTAFSIGTKGYITCGADCFSAACYKNDLWEWDQVTNAWTQMANFPGTARIGAVSFSIGTKGYAGTGNDGAYKKDFYEWDQTNNTWTPKANFPGTARQDAVGFSVDSLGYIGTGKGPGPKIDMYEYHPSSDTWIVKSNFPGTGKYAAVAFSIGNKGYHCTGFQGGTPPYTSELWEWDQSTDAWTQMASLSGAARIYGVGFSIGAKGYVGTGYNVDSIPAEFRDFWEWDQGTNTWTQQANYGYGNVAYGMGFSIGIYGYIMGGGTSSTFSNNLWQWGPTVTSVNENNIAEEISVYPNPSNGKFRIMGMIPIAIGTKTEIEIYDLAGEKIYQSEISEANAEIDLSGNAKGVYAVKINNGGKNYFQRVVVE
ncbi:MAG: T9SS type A sorting domain-containing protein [Bacteroidetes bacterium]|nr:T9SS type A sorting domain-containing protein [Bacteroidota bacterium]